MLRDNIRNWCKAKGVSISRLEEELGMPPHTIGRWDKNRPSIDRVKAVADYFGITVDELIKEGKDEEGRNKTDTEPL